MNLAICKVYNGCEVGILRFLERLPEKLHGLIVEREPEKKTKKTKKK